MPIGRLSLRSLSTANLDGLPVLDVTAAPSTPEGEQFTLFFARGVMLDAAKAQFGDDLISALC